MFTIEYNQHGSIRLRANEKIGEWSKDIARLEVNGQLYLAIRKYHADIPEIKVFLATYHKVNIADNIFFCK